jgi:hypothetical protein
MRDSGLWCMGMARRDRGELGEVVVRSESDRRARPGGRRGERSVASELGRRENGDRRADSSVWNRKDGGSSRRDVAVSTVAGSPTPAVTRARRRRAAVGVPLSLRQGRLNRGGVWVRGFVGRGNGWQLGWPEWNNEISDLFKQILNLT